MALFCTGCARRVRDRRGCPRCPMALVERVPPLDGWIWFGDDVPDEEPFGRGRQRVEALHDTCNRIAEFFGVTSWTLAADDDTLHLLAPKGEPRRKISIRAWNVLEMQVVV